MTSELPPQRFVFLDTEATGLDVEVQSLTEVAWIVRFEDGREETRQYFPEHSIEGADEGALEITAYDERIAPQPKTPQREWLDQFLEDATGAILVGAVPDFDHRFLLKTCRQEGLAPTWDHHLVDVETLALTIFGDGPQRPRSLAKTCLALGLEHDKEQAHGALYDAQQALRVFDRVWEIVDSIRRNAAPPHPAVPPPRHPPAAADAPSPSPPPDD